MADIDSLEIEISAESGDAAKKVNALAQALERLKSALQGGGFDSIGKQIRGLGEGADAAQQKINSKQKVLQNVRERVQSPSTSLRQSAKNVRDLTSMVTSAARVERELGLAEKRAEKFGQELINLQDRLDQELVFAPEFRNTDAVRDISTQIETLEGKAQSADDAVRRLRDALAGIKGKIQAADLEEAGQEQAPASRKMESLQRAMKQVDSTKFSLVKDLQRGEIQAIKTSRQLEGLTAKFQQLKSSPEISAQNASAFSGVEKRIEGAQGSFERLLQKAGEVNQFITELRKTPIDLNADGAKEQMEEILAQAKELRQELQTVQLDYQVSKERAADAIKEIDVTPHNLEVKSAGNQNLFSAVSEMFSGTKYGGQIGNITNLAEEINKVSTAASGASTATGELGAAASGAGVAGSAAMAGMAGAVGIVVAALEVLKQAFEKNKEFLQSDQSLWTDTSWENIGGGVQNVTAALMILHPELKAAVYGLRSFIQPGQELLGVLGSLAQSGFKNAGEALKDFVHSGFEKAGNAVKSFGASIGDGLKSVGSQIGQMLIKPFTSAIAAIQKWQASLGKMVFYRAINAAVRTVTEGIREGINNLYQFSSLAGGKFASSMNSLASSSMYLKNSLGAMAAPLLNAVAPAIEYVISRLVALINIIGALFSVITGQGSFVQAKKGAASFGDAVGGAAGAAKELQDYMTGIDELNVLKESGGGGGGGGGGGLGFEDMFEEVPLPDWAQDMKDAIDKGDWYGAGKILADYLNGIVANWDSYAWGKALGEKITNGLDLALGFLRNFDFDQFGRKLAEALNGLGDGINFDTLGRVIGAGWNAVFATIDGFFNALDWGKWGRNIGKAINGIVDEVHWDKIGKTISDGLIGFFTMLDNAILEIDWPQLGRSLATMLNNIEWEKIIFSVFKTIQDFIKGAAQALEEFCRTFQWGDVANQISAGINRSLSYMSESEWREIGRIIGEAFTKGFAFARDILKGIHWSQLGRDIAALLSGVQWGDLLETAGEAIAAGFNAVIDTAYEIVHNSGFWIRLGAGVKSGVTAFFNDFKIDKALDGLSQAIVNGINLAVNALSGLVQADTFWVNLGTGIRTGLNNFFTGVSPTDVVQAITGFLQRMLDTAVVTVSELASHGEWWQELGTAIGNGVNDLVSNTDWVSLLTGLATLATDILNGLVTAMRTVDWDEAWRVIKEALDNVNWDSLIDAGMALLSEAFHLKLKVKLFEGDMFLKIGGEVGESLLRGIDEGLSDIPILGFFYDLGKKILSILGLVGQGITAAVKGDWGEVLRITGEIANEIVGISETKGAETKETIKRHSGGAASEVAGAGRQMKTDWQASLEEMENNSDAHMKRISQIVKTEWTASKASTKEIVASTAAIASNTFESMRIAVEKKTGEIKTTSQKNWGDTKTDTTLQLEGMSKSTDINYGNMKKIVSTDLAAMEGENQAKQTAMAALTAAQQMAMATSTALQYGAMKKTVADSLNETHASTTSNLSSIVTTTNTKTAEALAAAKSNFGKVSGAVASGLQAAKAAAAGVSFYSVGTNIVDGVSAGVRAKADALASTVSASIRMAAEAARIAAQIHSPSKLFRNTVGIFIGLGIAEGVKDSAKDIVHTIQGVNAQMLNAFDPNIFQSPESMEFPVHQEAVSRVQVAYTYDSQHEEDTAQRLGESVRVANEDVISTLYAVAAQMVEAIDQAADRQPEVYLDGRKLMQNSEKHQRQRGVNIMARSAAV